MTLDKTIVTKEDQADFAKSLANVIDPKRTGVKASIVSVVFAPEPDATVYYNEKHRLCGPPGAYLDRHPQNTPNEWTLCCPGCGEAGGPRQGATWTATSGSFDDVTTLTLSPSIHCTGCCGWHGYLRNGIFESC